MRILPWIVLLKGNHLEFHIDNFETADFKRLQATVASEVLGTFLDEAMDQELAPFAPKSNTFRERCRNLLKEDQIT